MMKMKGNNKFDINKTEFLGSLKQKECYIIINVDEKNRKIALTVSKDIDVGNVSFFEDKFDGLFLKIFNKFYINRCQIKIASMIPYYITELLKMLHINAKMNEEGVIEFWTSKEKASLYLSYATKLNDIPDINFTLLWGVTQISEIFNHEYPEEYEFIEDKNIRKIAMPMLDHIVLDIWILDEEHEIEFYRMTGEGGAYDNEFVYTIKNEEKWITFFEFLNKILKQKGLKAKIIKNKNMEVQND